MWYGIWGGWECLGCDVGDADHQCKCSSNCVHPMFLRCKYNVLAMQLCTMFTNVLRWLARGMHTVQCSPDVLAMLARISWIVLFTQCSCKVFSEFLAMSQNLFTQCSWNVPPRFSQRPQFKLLLRICNVENDLKTIQHHSQLYISA